MIKSTNIIFARRSFVGIIKYCTIFVLASMSIHGFGQTITLEGNPGFVQTISISPNGKILATVHRTLGIQLRSLPDYSLLPALEHPDFKSKPWVTPKMLAFSDDNKRIAIVYDRRLLVFELSTQRSISDKFIAEEYTGENYGTTFINPVQIVVSAVGLGTALVDLGEDGSSTAKTKEIGPTPRGNRAVISASGNFVAMVRETKNQIELYSLDGVGSEQTPKRLVVLEGGFSDVLASTSDGKFLAVYVHEFVSKDVAERKSWAKVNLFSTETGKSVASIPVVYKLSTPVAKFLPGTRALVIAAPGGGLQLIDFSTGDVSLLLETSGSIVDLVLDQSGSTLVTLDIKGKLRYTELKTLVAELLKQQENTKKEAERQKVEASLIAQQKENEERIAVKKLRASVSIGDNTHCGMVISIKKPIVEIQTIVGTRWFRVDQLFPIGVRECQFLNGVYQEQPTK